MQLHGKVGSLWVIKTITNRELFYCTPAAPDLKSLPASPRGFIWALKIYGKRTVRGVQELLLPQGGGAQALVLPRGQFPVRQRRLLPDDRKGTGGPKGAGLGNGPHGTRR